MARALGTSQSTVGRFERHRFLSEDFVDRYEEALRARGWAPLDAEVQDDPTPPSDSIAARIAAIRAKTNESLFGGARIDPCAECFDLRGQLTDLQKEMSKAKLALDELDAVADQERAEARKRIQHAQDKAEEALARQVQAESNAATATRRAEEAEVIANEAINAIDKTYGLGLSDGIDRFRRLMESSGARLVGVKCSRCNASLNMGTPFGVINSERVGPQLACADCVGITDICSKEIDRRVNKQTRREELNKRRKRGF